ncbi:hypothetical protein LCGC14_1529070, partial [marine sediment metagenome]
MESEQEINQVTFEPTTKQFKALEYLGDPITEEVLFGGGAGGGKTVLGCFWLITNCLKYPGSRWLMGRAILKSLKESTVKTLFDMLANTFHFEKDVHYHYNEQAGFIRFYNGSEIVFKDLFLYPSDPEFDSLGSHEYTGAFIDEIQQCTNKAKEIVLTRLRYKIDEFGIVGKLLMCSNPTKNFAYYDFYKPTLNKTIKKTRVFIQALIHTNPHIPKSYVESLKRREGVTRQRLLEGNWNYDTGEDALFDFDSIVDMFTNTVEDSEDRFLSADISRFGADKTVIIQWKGFFIEKIYVYAKQSTSEVAKEIERIAEQNHIPRSKIVIDEDGLGGGVVDQLPGTKGFVNNSRPIETRKDEITSNYANLKSQCYFLLAKFVNEGKIGIYKVNETIKGFIVEDLEQIRQKDIDKDGKLAVVSKQIIKESLGRST